MMPFDAGMRRASDLARSGQQLQAEVLLLSLDKEWPQRIEPSHALAQLALHHEDFGRAAHWLSRCCERQPNAHAIRLELASALAADDKTDIAIQQLGTLVTSDPGAYYAWLLLGELLAKQGRAVAALKARYQAMTQANEQGQWLSADSVPEHLRTAVAHVASEVKAGQRELFLASYDSVREEFGGESLRRVDRALDGYLEFIECVPPDANQRPKFFFFPELPPGPYHDPNLQPWAQGLTRAFTQVRAEALKVWEQDGELPPFLTLTPEAKLDDYLTNLRGKPSWEAFFFYRHGRRYDENHRRCPATSSILESIDLCRVENQAPEICFSVLTPGTKIMPHYGVTNTRLVMHLPLVVPAQCALNVVNHGVHGWKEGELMMFDDTYQHEAWNHSDRPRIVLLMDCWNPHLTQPERLAVKLFHEAIAGFHASSLIADLPSADFS